MSRILVIVEGPDEQLAIGRGTHSLLSIIDPDKEFEVIPFCNPIYELYDLYKRGAYDDIVKFLRLEKGLTIDGNILSKKVFSSIYLIFDYEPNYQKYSDQTVRDLINTFNNETENGKLYINYPMFESFYHIKSIPDNEYKNRTISLNLSHSDVYKAIVNRETIFKKNKISKRIIKYIIKINYEKAVALCEVDSQNIDYMKLLNKQINIKNEKSETHILCTFPLIAIDYNPSILKSILIYNPQQVL